MVNSHNKSKGKKILIFDTSAISVLFRISLLNKIIAYKKATNVELMLPSVVHDELRRYKSFPRIKEFLEQNFKVIIPPNEVMEEIERKKSGLGPGEISVIASVISITREDNEAIVMAIIDDKRGRKSAKAINLEVHGSLWIITQLKKHNIITKEEAVNSIRTLPQHGFHISEEDLQAVIEEIRRDC